MLHLFCRYLILSDLVPHIHLSQNACSGGSFTIQDWGPRSFCRVRYIMKNRCVESSFALTRCLVSDFVSFLLTIPAPKTSTTSACTEHMSLGLAVGAWRWGTIASRTAFSAPALAKESLGVERHRTLLLGVRNSTWVVIYNSIEVGGDPW